MSDLVDQINKLEAKAQSLKESVSTFQLLLFYLNFAYFRENMLTLSKSSMN
jgi:hypothetical protein